jgi:siderophore ferric iron reductase
MARSFLFSPDSPDVATTRLIATAAEHTGFMKGEPGEGREGWYRPGGDNSEFFRGLHQSLVAAHPKAGAPLYAVRLWTNMLWQPAYLAAVAVHLHGAMPDLSRLSQNRRGQYVDGYRLIPGDQTKGTPEELIALAGNYLRPMAQRFLAEVNQIEKLRPLPARRLFADRMLSIMLWLGRRRPELTTQDVFGYTELWLKALDLFGQGELQQVEAGGRQLLISRRKGCCLDYLLPEAQYCASCPKQSDALRLARQTEAALAEAV